MTILNPDYNQPTSLIQCGHPEQAGANAMQTTGELIKLLEAFPRGTVLFKRLDDGFSKATVVVKATGEHRNGVEVSVETKPNERYQQ